MSDTQAKAAAPSLWRKILIRVITILVVGDYFQLRDDFGDIPTGKVAANLPVFLRGVVNGAMMPCAMPYLLLGRGCAAFMQRRIQAGL